jgi:two-component system phosphate regulon sensor histidine kinase PhoR
MIDDLLNLSNIERLSERGGIELKPQPIAPIIRSAIEVCVARRPDKKDSVTVVCPGDLSAAVNRSLLEQAVINLVENALKYSGQNARVQIRAAVDDKTVTLTVSDNGPGIAPEHLPRLFERFYRVDKSRTQSGGTGLGLAIVKHIMEAHGGRVDVTSQLGKGSSFTLYLPRR